ncbi:hypothetical protein [Marinibactrum halimedae]|uniref:Uncharacterized protein n=1 Tax=Marinibactrum halimedae TaxID=1444977 RepID=A0AA37T9T1_9GAMM|nr:hypothetical protein [Marinibactrum halimedae]MCD9459887.1 hypothetical protein [Marinibactrum halimedae]GLS25257.1 hypothetical protein GCM10007877_09710 [Marinibactrum halimedae]
MAKFEKGKRFLKDHYLATSSVIFKQFKWGAVLFFLGLVLVYAAFKMEPSLSQEWVLLLGLILVGVGFLMAMMAQVRMLISRILRFWLDK